MVEAFRSLRASVLLSTADHPPGSLLITSTQPGEGKTTVATNLAISLAQLGQRVLLVDADLRFPSLQRLFCIRENLGLVSYLTGQEDWRTAVCPSGSSGLDLLPCGPVPPNPAELLSSKSMGAFLGSAKSEYALVILDSSPLLTLADSRILASLVDGVLLVAKSGATPREQIRQSQSGIRSAYNTGRGSIMMRARHHLEEGRGDRRSIVLTAIPYQVGKAGEWLEIRDAAIHNEGAQGSGPAKLIAIYTVERGKPLVNPIK